MRVTKLTPFGGFSAETSSGLTISIASLLGIPVSTTHTITGAIIGVGSIRSTSCSEMGSCKKYFMGMGFNDAFISIVCSFNILLIDVYQNSFKLDNFLVFINQSTV